MIRSFAAALCCLLAAPALATEGDWPGHGHGRPQAPTTAQAGAAAAATATAAATSSAGAQATGGRAAARGGSAVATSGGVVTNAPPGFGLPSFGGGVCATVGFGLGISPSGGGALGPSWESTNCNRRETAKILISTGRIREAEHLLQQDPEVAAAFAAFAPPPASVPPVPPVAMAAAKPNYCRGMPGWMLQHYPQCK